MEGGLKDFAIFLNIFAGIPFGESEIQHFVASERAASSFRGAEAVDQPREGAEGRGLKKAYTVWRSPEFPSIVRSRDPIFGSSRSGYGFCLRGRHLNGPSIIVVEVNC